MTTALARAIAQWRALNTGQPETRALRARSIEHGAMAEVWSDPPGLFAPDVFVIARAAEDFIVSKVSSEPNGVVFTVINASRTLMPRRFDGWLIGGRIRRDSPQRIRR